MSVYTASGGYGNVVIGGAGNSASTISISGAGTNGQVLTMANGSTGTTWANTNVARTTARGQLHLEGEDADLVINGVKLSDILNGITDRLAILQPKPELLEKYENLREAYEHYKTLEALLHQAEDNNG
jgi:hypothetical protein